MHRGGGPAPWVTSMDAGRWVILFGPEHVDHHPVEVLGRGMERTIPHSVELRRRSLAKYEDGSIGSRSLADLARDSR